MKKIISITILCAFILTLAACANNATQEPQASETIQTTEQTKPNNPVTSNPSLSDPFETSGMPIPFEHMGGDQNHTFSDRYMIKFTSTSIIEDEIIEYLKLSLNLTEEEVIDVLTVPWAGSGGNLNYWRDIVPTSGLMEIPSLLWYIVEFNIPDDVILEGIRKHNEHFGRLEWDEDRIFTEEDIAAILTRDPAIITAQFAQETATIVINDMAFSPAWLYLHTPEDYEEVGITPEMIKENLDLYSEFHLTDEADEAFSEKLSEFIGEEVSLKKIRNQNNQGQNDNSQGSHGNQGGRGDGNSQ